MCSATTAPVVVEGKWKFVARESDDVSTPSSVVETSEVPEDPSAETITTTTTSAADAASALPLTKDKKP